MAREWTNNSKNYVCVNAVKVETFKKRTLSDMAWKCATFKCNDRKAFSRFFFHCCFCCCSAPHANIDFDLQLCITIDNKYVLCMPMPTWKCRNHMVERNAHSQRHIWFSGSPINFFFCFWLNESHSSVDKIFTTFYFWTRDYPVFNIDYRGAKELSYSAAIFVG